MSDISKFNPYLLKAAEIIALNTGREKELAFVTGIIERNKERGTGMQHILIHGPRGIGKSFFLRLLQIHLEDKAGILMLLLPEEQMNIYQPSDLLMVINNRLQQRAESASIAPWFVASEDDWESETNKLKTAVRLSGKHLVIGIENFDLLFSGSGAFGTEESQYRFRHFLTYMDHITFVATALFPELDNQYEQPLFHSFTQYELAPWQEAQHQAYLEKRAQAEKVTAAELSSAQLKSLTHFTGGTPRITAIMVDILNHGQLDSTTNTLKQTVDVLTPYYQDLLDRIPARSRLLFDALVRGGEPCSQSNLAKRVGTTQNIISQSFQWLLLHRYLKVEIPPGKKLRLYSVRDRLFVHYYKMRYVLPEAGKTTLSIMAEFLTGFYSRQELLGHAQDYNTKGSAGESRDLYRMVLEQAEIAPELLAWKDDLQALIKAAGLLDTATSMPATYEEAREQLIQARDMLAAYQGLPRGVDGKELAREVFGSPVIAYRLKIQLMAFIIDCNFKELKEIITNLGNIRKKNILPDFKDALNEYSLLSDSFYNGKIIWEYLSDEALQILKDLNLLKTPGITVISIIVVIAGYSENPLPESFIRQLTASLYIFLKYIIESNDDPFLPIKFLLNLPVIQNDITFQFYNEILIAALRKEPQLLLKAVKTFALQTSNAIAEKPAANIYPPTVKYLTRFSQHPDIFPPAETLNAFFSTLLQSTTNYQFAGDLLDAAAGIYGAALAKEIGALKTITTYLASDRNPNLLLEMEPEIREASTTAAVLIAETLNNKSAPG